MTKDIARAYAAELRYYQDKEAQHSNVLDIMDYIVPCGYDTYGEYYADAQVYMLRTLDYDVVEEPYIDPAMPLPYLNERRPAFLYTIHCGTNYAFVKNDFDKEDVLSKHGYRMTKLGYEFSSGPILSSDGDLRIYLIYPIQIDLNATYFLEKFREYFSEYFTDVAIDNNDIMIAGKKVCGSVMFDHNEMKVLLMQINFSDKEDIIREICGPSAKAPGYIDPTILGAEQLKNEFVSWLSL